MISVKGREVTFRVLRPNAKRVSVVVDPSYRSSSVISMTKRDGDYWEASGIFSAGEHEFWYLVDGAEVIDREVFNRNISPAWSASVFSIARDLATQVA